jgi:hypothetical protein
MPIHQFVHCPSEKCKFHREPILLPDSNPPQTDPDPANWPKGGTELYVACPRCRLVSVYTETHTRDFGPEAQSQFRRDRVWLRISYLCAVADCTTLSQFHTLAEKASEANIRNAINDRFVAGFWTGAMACGHPIGIPRHPNFRLVEGAMEWHDPTRD